MDTLAKIVSAVNEAVNPEEAERGQGRKKKGGPNPNQGQNQGQNKSRNQNQNQGGSSGGGSGQNPQHKKQQGGGKPGGQNQNQNQNANPNPQKQRQNQGPNQAQNQSQNIKPQRSCPPQRNPNFKNPPPAVNYKTGLGQGRGKKYNTNTCLFISGMVIPENKSALRFLEDLMIDDMALDFRPLEIIKLEPQIFPGEEEETANAEEAARTLVAIFSNPLHVQEILNKAQTFKSSEENLTKYGKFIHFEGYLTKDEQTVKRAMLRRVRDLNRQVSTIENAAELGLEAKVLSKNSFQHMGNHYIGFFPRDSDSSIVWKSYQPLRQKRKTHQSDSSKEGGAAGGAAGGEDAPQSPSDGDEFTVLGLPEVPTH